MRQTLILDPIGLLPFGCLHELKRGHHKQEMLGSFFMLQGLRIPPLIKHVFCQLFR